MSKNIIVVSIFLNLLCHSMSDVPDFSHTLEEHHEKAVGPGEVIRPSEELVAVDIEEVEYRAEDDDGNPIRTIENEGLVDTGEEDPLEPELSLVGNPILDTPILAQEPVLLVEPVGNEPQWILARQDTPPNNDSAISVTSATTAAPTTPKPREIEKTPWIVLGIILGFLVLGCILYFFMGSCKKKKHVAPEPQGVAVEPSEPKDAASPVV